MYQIAYFHYRHTNFMTFPWLLLTDLRYDISGGTKEVTGGSGGGEDESREPDSGQNQSLGTDHGRGRESDKRIYSKSKENRDEISVTV